MVCILNQGNPDNDIDDINAMCDKFTDEELVGDENAEMVMSMKMAKKLKTLAMNTTFIQPAACFLLS